MSTKEVLSEGELDALMDTFSGEEAANTPVAGPGECVPFDFSTREQTLLAQMPALKKLNEKHSMALAQVMQELYGVTAQVNVVDIQLLKLDQALANVVEPAAINLAQMPPLNGVSYIVLPGVLLSFVVDAYFGGSTVAASTEFTRKSLTPTELRINEVLVGKFTASLVEAWSEKIQLSPQLDGLETSPTYLQANSPDDLALVFPFQFTVGEWSATLDWIVPYAALEPLRQKLCSLAEEAVPAQKSSAWEEHFQRELAHVQLEISGTFESGPVSISEVLNLRPGSIVPLKMPTHVAVAVENQPFSLGEHGVLNGNKSIKITEIIKHEPDQA